MNSNSHGQKGQANHPSFILMKRDGLHPHDLCTLPNKHLESTFCISEMVKRSICGSRDDSYFLPKAWDVDMMKNIPFSSLSHLCCWLSNGKWQEMFCFKVWRTIGNGIDYGEPKHSHQLVPANWCPVLSSKCSLQQNYLGIFSKWKFLNHKTKDSIHSVENSVLGSSFYQLP